jgi:hypothetical protein
MSHFHCFSSDPDYLLKPGKTCDETGGRIRARLFGEPIRNSPDQSHVKTTRKTKTKKPPFTPIGSWAIKPPKKNR